LALFSISFLYKIDINNENYIDITFLKRILYLSLFPLLFLSISWRNVKFELFGYSILSWNLIHIFLFFYADKNLNYLLRVLQATLVYLLVIYFSQTKIVLNVKIKNFLNVIVFIVTAALVFFAFVNINVAENIYNGFGGNRVFFSIWLTQLIFFILYSNVTLFEAKKKADLLIISKCFITIIPIFLLQILTSGRIGLLVSFCILNYYLIILFRLNFSKSLLFIVGFLCFTLAFDHFSPITRIHNETFITRGIKVPTEIIRATGNKSLALNPYKIIDTATSHRLSILVSGVKNESLVSLKEFLFGVGIEKAEATAETQVYGSYRPHNIYLNHLMEIGIFALLSLLCIVTLPFFSKEAVKTNKEKILFFIVISWSLFIANLQPELLLSQVSSSIAYWFAYGIFLRKRFCKY